MLPGMLTRLASGALQLHVLHVKQVHVQVEVQVLQARPARPKLPGRCAGQPHSGAKDETGAAASPGIRLEAPSTLPVPSKTAAAAGAGTRAHAGTAALARSCSPSMASVASAVACSSSRVSQCRLSPGVDRIRDMIASPTPISAK